jgi:hypothetical protein
MRIFRVRGQKTTVPGIAVTLGLIFASLYAVIVSLELIPPLQCPWRTLLGFECPMCGTTRALEAIGRGDVKSAIALNPLAILLALAAVAVAINELAGATFRCRLSIALSVREGRVLLGAFLVLLAANWAYVLLR